MDPVKNTPALHYSEQGISTARTVLDKNVPCEPGTSDIGDLTVALESFTANPEITCAEKTLARFAAYVASSKTIDDSLRTACVRTLMSAVAAALPGSPAAVIAGSVLQALGATADDYQASGFMKETFTRLQCINGLEPGEKELARLGEDLSYGESFNDRGNITLSLRSVMGVLAGSPPGGGVERICMAMKNAAGASSDPADSYRTNMTGLWAIGNHQSATPAQKELARLGRAFGRKEDEWNEQKSGLPATLPFFEAIENNLKPDGLFLGETAGRACREITNRNDRALLVEEAVNAIRQNRMASPMEIAHANSVDTIAFQLGSTRAAFYRKHGDAVFETMLEKYRESARVPQCRFIASLSAKLYDQCQKGFDINQGIRALVLGFEMIENNPDATESEKRLAAKGKSLATTPPPPREEWENLGKTMVTTMEILGKGVNLAGLDPADLDLNSMSELLMGDRLAMPAPGTSHQVSIDDRFIEIDGIRMDRNSPGA